MGLHSFKTWIAIACLSLVVLAPLSATIIYIANYTEENFALEDSKAFTSILQNVQSFYAKEIVSHAKKNNIKIDRDYKAAGTALPFPATFTHDLIARLNTKYKDLKFFFYSDHPFYQRPQLDQYEQFHKEALSTLKKNNQDEFYKIDHQGAISEFRYARAIRMEQDCVQCHNSHPDSPVKTWKVGDVRGVQSVAIELPGFSFWKNGHLNPLIMIVIILYLFGVLCLISLFYSLRTLKKERQQRDLIKKKNDELQTANNKIEEYAYYDMVTGLANRIFIINHINDFIENSRKKMTAFSLMLLDLDHFKSVNDRYGHNIGDDLLREVGQRLKNMTDEFGGSAIAGRLSGDEFVLFFNGLRDIGEIEAITNKIIKDLSRFIELNNVTLKTGASLGVSRYPRDGKNAEQLLTNAGLALNEAKQKGRCKHWVFDRTLQIKQDEANKIEVDLKQALFEKHLEIFYQPKVCLQSGKLHGFEALLRWPHQELGFIAPDKFLPIAEERGLIIPVSHYVCERVAADLSTWLEQERFKGRIALNVHPNQLKNFEEMDKVISVFVSHNVPLHYLTLEITEGCIIGRGTENTHAILHQLIDNGISVSLDDFGTGYASLTHLKNLPVDEVKIDKSFIQDILINKDSEAIVRAIIELCDKIGLQVVAEGIETQEQLQKLLEMGCDIGQGYFFAPPSARNVISGFLSAPTVFMDKVPLKADGKLKRARDSH